MRKLIAFGVMHNARVSIKRWSSSLSLAVTSSERSETAKRAARVLSEASTRGGGERAYLGRVRVKRPMQPQTTMPWALKARWMALSTKMRGWKTRMSWMMSAAVRGRSAQLGRRHG